MVGRVDGAVEAGEAVIVSAGERGGDLEESLELEGDEDEIEGGTGEDEVVDLPSSRRRYGGFYAPRPLHLSASVSYLFYLNRKG